MSHCFNQCGWSSYMSRCDTFAAELCLRAGDKLIMRKRNLRRNLWYVSIESHNYSLFHGWLFFTFFRRKKPVYIMFLIFALLFINESNRISKCYQWWWNMYVSKNNSIAKWCLMNRHGQDTPNVRSMFYSLRQKSTRKSMHDIRVNT